MFVGIDLGTSSVKTLLMDHAGVVIRTVSKPYDVLMPQPGWTEQDPLVWFDQTLTALKELIVGYESNIEAISFSGQMHGMVTLDANDEVIRPAILWNDQRTIHQVDEMVDQFGLDGNLARTGNIPLTGLTAPKVLWMKQFEPDRFSKVLKVMLPKDYLVYRLTGMFVTDVSDISGSHFYHPESGEYNAEIIAFCSLTPSMLPTVLQSNQVVGPILPTLQDTLGFTQPVNIIIGGGDQAVGAVGVGVVEPGMASLSLGTSGVLFVPTASFVVDSVNHLQSYADASGHHHVMGVLLNAAGVIKWWLEDILKQHDYSTFYQMIDDRRLDDHCHYLPYMSGERFPVNDPKAKGVFFGLGYYHDQALMSRAVVEGVTMSLKEAFEKVQQFQPNITTLRITGGGAKSKVWVQMISDALNVDVVTLQTEEGPSYGAAILAYSGHKKVPVSKVSSQLIQLNQSVTPRPEWTDYYNKRYGQYKKLYPPLKVLF
jgi:xylulokinase